ncbi:MAG: DUF2497 domain-containing protein [Rhizobiaceae bacterium]|nr:DUF2497 domain-containing protein [Rhizobiaceae bacterium]
MAEVAKKEPSMEDILSSIRKIIAEEGSAGTAQAAAQEAPSAEPIAEQPNVEMSSELRPSMDATVSEGEAMTASLPPVAEAEMAAPVEPAYSAPETTSNMMSEMPVDHGVPEGVEEDSGSTSLASIAASIQNVAQGAQATAEPEQAAPIVEDIVEAPVFEEPAAIADEPVAAAEEPAVFVEPAPAQEEAVHVEMAEATPAPVAEPVIEAAVALPTEEDMAREEEAFRGALMSPSADNAVAGSFDRLKRSAMDDIEATTEAILRPMLREWLDENLPSLVERLVREEIERVARG